jgi:hypothetical protein
MAMDHAEAHERIADLALDRDAVARLESEGSAADPFLEHVRDCAACQTELAAVRDLDRGLREALGALRDTAAIEPIHPPESLRDAVLEAARREPRLAPAPTLATGVPSPVAPAAMPASNGRWWRLELPRLTAPQWAAGLAAVLVIAILGGVAGRALAPGTAGPDPSMVAAVATLDRVLNAPDHRLVTLATPAGAASGSVAWTAQDFVVLTSALSEPQPGRVYRCWLQWAGKWAAVGSMDFAGSTAYWTGSPGAWTELLAAPGTRFVVTAEAAGPAGDAPTGSVLLQASLSS